MTKKQKIIIGIFSIFIVSGIGVAGFIIYLMSMFTTEYQGKQALREFEYITEISNAPINETYFLVETLGINPTFYFHFRTNKDFIEELIDKHGLKEESIKSYNCQKLLNINIWRLWWNPKNFQFDKCYSGYSNGNDYYLIYHPDSGNTFLHIQNT